jgi:hypothetical protein
MIGASVSIQSLIPGMDFWEAITDGQGEALLLKSQYDARVRSHE